MATAQDIVTEAFRAINAIDINDSAPSPAEMNVGLNRLSRMIAAWAGQGLAVGDVSLTGTLTSGSATVTLTSPVSTSNLAPGLNISGTGIPASTRVLSVDSPTQFTMNANATASGDQTLSFTAIPFETKHEEGVISLLAQRLAVAPEDVPGWVQQTARDGWMGLQAQFIVVPQARVDNALTNMTQSNPLQGVILGNG